MNHALVAQGSQSKWKKKPKPKTESHESSTSSKENKPKKEKFSCVYCKKKGNDEHHCYTNKIDEISHLLQKNNIPLPSSVTPSSTTSASPSASSYESSSKPTQSGNVGFASGKEDKLYMGKGHALVTSTFHSGRDRWFLDSGASHHMGFSPYPFLGLHPTDTSKILLGASKLLDVAGVGNVEIGDGCFRDVLCIPDLHTNLLSIY